MPGRLVPVAAGQSETLIEWWRAFAAEARDWETIAFAPGVTSGSRDADGGR